MTARRAVDPAAARTNDALTDARRHARPSTASGTASGTAPGAANLLALQRSAGNAAVGALMAAKLRQPAGDAVGDIDTALTEIRRDDPEIEPIEKGLQAAKAAGVPVELQGPKPPASALAVKRTGFGPEAVAPKRPVAPPKATPATSALGRAGAHAPAKHASKPAGGAGAAGAAAQTGGAPVIAPPAPLSADQLNQPPVAPEGTRPEQDPAFTHVTGSVTSLAKAKKSHPPAGSKAAEAQGAALAPADDLTGQAKAAKADTMDAQQPGAFDKKTFIAAVKTAIEAKSPKTLSEADDYAESGKAGEVKGEVKGLVTQGKDGQTKDIATATDAPPDTTKAVAKPVTPMATEQAGAAGAIAGAGAAPKPAPSEQLNLAAGKQQADQELAGADVTEPQLAQSNEPEFQQALADKNAAAAHADSAPGQFRQHEQQVIADHKKGAESEASGAVAGMQGSKAAALASLVADKGKAKTADEAKRAEVTTKIQGIFNATETDVKKILDGIDPKVEAAFDQGEAAAKASFESYVSAKMSAFKDDRYSGWTGGLKWAKDKLLGMPDKVNEFYAAGRELYLKQMDGVISHVADIVGGDLTAAKQRIASGRAEISTYVKSLPTDLRKVGADATSEINDKFEQLESDVTAKQDSVVDTMATKYTEARKGLDDRIEELQAENKGLVDKAIDGIKGVINTIRELASMLGSVLARAAGVVGDIIKAPVAFLGNLVAGVKGGVLKFADNILDHLRKGLMSWLFGTLAQSGVEMPDTFDIKGVVKLLASVFGLTWANIRNRLVKQIGEKAMSAAEKGVEIFQIIAGQGVAGLWQMLVEKLGDIKEMILDAVKDFVVTKVIMSGITWLIGLLNPAAAFIKACKLIYDVIMFFVNNASRIMAFVNTIIDSTVEIVKGNVGGVIDKINDVLGKMVPILIGFLASVLGLGGIGEKIRGIIGKLQKPINKAMDFIIKKGLKLAGPIIRGIKGISGKVKSKVAAGKAWVRGKVDAGKKWVGDKIPGGNKEEKAIADADKVLSSSRSHRDAQSRVAALSQRHGVPLNIVVESRGAADEHVHVQTMATSSHVLPTDESLDEDSASDSAGSLLETTAAQVSESHLNDMGRRRAPGKGKELALVRSGPVRLSAHAVSVNKSWVLAYARQSPASAGERNAAVAYAHERIDIAAETEREEKIYSLLRQAAVRIQDLYGGRDVMGFDVEHLDEVAQNPETYIRTRISRKVSAAAGRLNNKTPKAGTPEVQIAGMKGLSRKQRNEIIRLYAEQLVDQSLGDVGETGPADVPEIELLIISTTAHQAATARRNAERAHGN